MPLFITPYTKQRYLRLCSPFFYTFPLSVQGMSVSASYVRLPAHAFTYWFMISLARPLPAVFGPDIQPQKENILSFRIMYGNICENSSRNASSSVASPFKKSQRSSQSLCPLQQEKVPVHVPHPFKHIF